MLFLDGSSKIISRGYSAMLHCRAGNEIICQKKTVNASPAKMIHGRSTMNNRSPPMLLLLLFLVVRGWNLYIIVYSNIFIYIYDSSYSATMNQYQSLFNLLDHQPYGYQIGIIGRGALNELPEIAQVSVVSRVVTLTPRLCKVACALNGRSTSELWPNWRGIQHHKKKDNMSMVSKKFWRDILLTGRPARLRGTKYNRVQLKLQVNVWQIQRAGMITIDIHIYNDT